MKALMLSCMLATVLAPSVMAVLPSGPGLAAKMHGAALAKDPHVLLYDDFETGTIADLAKRWTEVSNKGNKVAALVAGSAPNGGGKRCLQMTSTLAENTGGHLYSHLPRDVDKVFARFYVKFSQDCDYIHHFVHLGGYQPATNWPQGGAGDRPNGDERITVGIEPHGKNGRRPPPGLWTFYCYWDEMKISADKRYWGNGLAPVEPQVIPKGKWQCVEVMLKLNTPGQRDGELALWLDGKLVSYIHKGTPRGPWDGEGFETLARGGEPFEGFLWRTSPDLKINFFWLMLYVTENAAKQNHTSPAPSVRVWFDDVVVATEYVGPNVPL